MTKQIIHKIIFITFTKKIYLKNESYIQCSRALSFKKEKKKKRIKIDLYAELHNTKMFITTKGADYL